MKRLKDQYAEDITAQLQSKFEYSNVMEIPRLTKISLNMGLGEAVSNGKVIEAAANDLQLIAGQKPVVTRARRSIASFKLREGMPIGAKVTLRGDRMWEFMERLFNIAMPAIRDFRGVNPRGFDGRGNFTLGIKEHIIFPEIDYDKVDKIRGLNITFVTTAKTDEEGRELLTLLGMPFRK